MKFGVNVLLNLINQKKQKKINFFLDTFVDATNFNYLKQNFFNSKKIIKTTYAFLPYKLNQFFLNATLDYFDETMDMQFLNNILIFNINLRLLLPNLHLCLRQKLKNKNFLVISFGNTDFLLFKHLNFGNNYSFANKLLAGLHWSNGVLIKNIKTSFLLNIEKKPIFNIQYVNFFNKTIHYKYISSIKHFCYNKKHVFFYLGKFHITNLKATLLEFKTSKLKKS